MINSKPLANTSTTKSARITLFDVVEYLYTMYLWYSMFGVWAGVALPYLGSAWLAGMGFLALHIFNWKGYQKRHLFLVAAISGSHILIQVVFYNTPLTNGYVINYLWWPVNVVIIAALMQRPNFIKRLVSHMFVTALIWSPFVIFRSDGGIERATLDAGNALDNPNAYAYWLGFCVVIFWLWSLKRNNVFGKLWLLSWAAVAFSLALRSVSRGFLIVVGLAMLISFRNDKFMRSMFLLFIGGGLLVFAASETDFFQQYFQSYTLRSQEESSRAVVLELGIEAIARRPITGYGIPRLRAILPITPHNELVLLWITSGIIPSILYIALAIFIIRIALRFNTNKFFISPLPLALFALTSIFSTNVVLPRLWAIVAVCHVFAVADHMTEEAHVQLANNQTDQMNSHLPVPIKNH